MLGYLLYLLFEGPSDRFTVVCQRWIHRSEDNDSIEKRNTRFWCGQQQQQQDGEGESPVEPSIKAKVEEKPDEHDGVISIRF